MADRNVVGKRPFVDQLERLSPAKDGGLLGVREDGEIEVYPKTSKDSVPFDKMNESRQKEEMERGSNTLKEAFNVTFGPQGKKLLARTAAKEDIRLDRALTVGQAKKLFGRAPEIAEKIVADAAERIRLGMPTPASTPERLHDNGNARRALADSGSDDLLPSSTEEEPDLQSYAERSDGSPAVAPASESESESSDPPDMKLQFAKSLNFRKMLDTCTFLDNVADDRQRQKFYHAMDSFAGRMTGSPSFPRKENEAKPLLVRAAQIGMIAHDIRSRKKLYAGQAMKLDAVLARAFRFPDDPAHALSGKCIHAALAAGNLDMARIALSRGEEAMLFVASRPSGLAIDAKGHISGAMEVDTVPMGVRRTLRGQDGKSLEEIMKVSLKKLFDVTPDKLHNVMVAHGLEADLKRFHYVIPTGDVLPSGDAAPPYRSQGQTNLSDDKRARNILRKLNEFAQGNTALVRVLTTPLCQGAWHAIQDFFTDVDGNAVPWLRSAGGLRLEFTLQQLRNGDYKVGVVQRVNCKIERADYDLATEAEQLQQAIQQADTMRVGLRKLTGNEEIGVTFRADVIIDGTEAAKGKLRVSVPDGVQIEFSDPAE